MNMAVNAARLAESFDIPDFALRAGIAAMVGRTSRKLGASTHQELQDFAQWMAHQPVASDTQEANRQHYEVPAAFFDQVLGPQRKYSCCYFEKPSDTLAQAEETALRKTAEHAGLANGQAILELGCGWGSLTLWMAKNFPQSNITAVSNSHSQRASIMERAREQGLNNVEVITQDMNAFAAPSAYDRIVSVEMFEHMRNWPALLARVHGWLKPQGRLFIHVFTHTKAAYAFDTADPADWIAQHFFTGGVMPAHDLPALFNEHFSVEQDWRWSGDHYERTANLWLENFDQRLDAIMPVLNDVYGSEAMVWKRRWRLSFLATAGLFGYAKGAEWGVSHYRMAAR